MDSFTEEFEKMRALRHPHCAKVFELVRNQEIVEGFPHQQLFIITEYARGGDLVQYMQTATLHGGLSEEIVAKMFQQAMEGVAYVHSCKATHNDLKLENILAMDEFRPDIAPRIVIADFGCVRLAADQRVIFGDPRYQSPESIQKMQLFLKDTHTVVSKLDSKLDIWSMGVTLFQLFSGGILPFLYINCGIREFRDHCDAMTKCVTGPEAVRLLPYCKDASCDAREMLLALLCKDPSQRPSAADILNHIWLQKKGIPKCNLPLQGIKFSAAKDLEQQILVNKLAAKLQHEHLKECHSIFRALDTDNKGVIDPAQFRMALGSLGRDRVDVDTIFEMGDIDKNGLLEFNEFVSMTFDWESLEPVVLDGYVRDLVEDLASGGQEPIKRSDFLNFFAGASDRQQLCQAFARIEDDSGGCITHDSLKRFILQHIVALRRSQAA